MAPRLRRSTMVLVLVAGAIAPLFDATPANAAQTTINFSIANPGSAGGTVYLEANWSGCGGGSPDGSGYDAGFDWDTSGVLSKRVTPTTTWPTDPTNVPDGASVGCGSKPLTNVRIEIYPKLNTYDPWTGDLGGAHAERSDAGVTTFGAIPLPHSSNGGFRITGNIVSKSSVADKRLKIDMFQKSCPDWDPCPALKSTNLVPNLVGAFSTSFSNNASQWTGSIGWPGRYQIYINDCSTGWSGTSCAGTIRRVVGFMEIANGNVPDIDLDAPCFGLYTCVHTAGAVPSQSVGEFHPMTPTRLLDTRKLGTHVGDSISRGDGALPDNYNPFHRTEETKNHELKVLGVAGIPKSGVAAVLLNVTAVNPPGKGWVTVYPRPVVPNNPAVFPQGFVDFYDNQATYYGTRPSTSNLNVTPGETVPNLVLARVGAGGTIRFWNANPGGEMDVLVDVAGWYDTSATITPAGGLGFTPVTPVRLIDTRDDDNPDTFGRLFDFDEVELQITGENGVPNDAESAVINIVGGVPTGQGYITAYPTGEAVPDASNMNFTPGITRANLAVVKIGAGGKITLRVRKTDADLLVDLMGYFSPAGDETTIINPTRVYDSRYGPGSPLGRMNANSTRRIRVAGGSTGLPSGVTAVLLNVTAVESDSWGFLTVWPAGLARPTASNINWPNAGRDTPNMVMVGVTDGEIDVYNSTLGTIHVIVDVLGYVI